MLPRQGSADRRCAQLASPPWHHVEPCRVIVSICSHQGLWLLSLLALWACSLWIAPVILLKSSPCLSRDAWEEVGPKILQPYESKGRAQRRRLVRRRGNLEEKVLGFASWQP